MVMSAVARAEKAKLLITASGTSRITRWKLFKPKPPVKTGPLVCKKAV